MQGEFNPANSEGDIEFTNFGSSDFTTFDGGSYDPIAYWENEMIEPLTKITLHLHQIQL